MVLKEEFIEKKTTSAVDTSWIVLHDNDAAMPVFKTTQLSFKGFGTGSNGNFQLEVYGDMIMLF